MPGSLNRRRDRTVELLGVLMLMSRSDKHKKHEAYPIMLRLELYGTRMAFEKEVRTFCIHATCRDCFRGCCFLQHLQSILVFHSVQVLLPDEGELGLSVLLRQPQQQNEIGRRKVRLQPVTTRQFHVSAAMAQRLLAQLRQRPGQTDPGRLSISYCIFLAGVDCTAEPSMPWLLYRWV